MPAYTALASPKFTTGPTHLDLLIPSLHLYQLRPSKSIGPHLTAHQSFRSSNHTATIASSPITTSHPTSPISRPPQEMPLLDPESPLRSTKN